MDTIVSIVARDTECVVYTTETSYMMTSATDLKCIFTLGGTGAEIDSNKLVMLSIVDCYNVGCIQDGDECVCVVCFEIMSEDRTAMFETFMTGYSSTPISFHGL